MMKKEEQYKEPESHSMDDMLSSYDVVSSTECTGMIPTPPLTDDEVDGYLDIFHVPQQKAEEARKADSPEEQKSRSTES